MTRVHLYISLPGLPLPKEAPILMPNGIAFCHCLYHIQEDMAMYLPGTIDQNQRLPPTLSASRMLLAMTRHIHVESRQPLRMVILSAAAFHGAVIAPLAWKVATLLFCESKRSRFERPCVCHLQSALQLLSCALGHASVVLQELFHVCAKVQQQIFW